MDRRDAILAGLSGLVAASRAAAQPVTEVGSLPGDSTEFMPLWPGKPPGGAGINLTLAVHDSVGRDGFHVRGVSKIQTPGFFLYRPAHPNGLGLLVIPGGGYTEEGADRGGREIAQYFAGLGITCFVLRYRLPGEGWENRASVPLQDAQRAMRLIRHLAADYGVQQLAAIGFSAGGHLGAALATLHGLKTYEPVDDADMLSAKPMVTGLLYPVITMGDGAHQGSVDALLGPAPQPAAMDSWSLEKQVTPEATPCFVALAADDRTVPPFPNGIAFFGALRAHAIPAELHVYQDGGHGFSLHWAQGKPASSWPQLFSAWAATHGFTA